MSKSLKIKKIVFTTLALLVFSLCFAGCSGGKTLTEKDNGGSIELNISDIVEINLESNPTTGYSWFLGDDIDNTVILVTGPEFIESKKDKDAVGAGGHEVFTVQAISRGKTKILLNYERPWEEEEPLEIFEITISVD